MKTQLLGRDGPRVSILGLGCMGMSDLAAGATESDSHATIRDALASGVTLFDTGDFYGMGHNEMLLSGALQGIPRESYQLSVKFGAQRGPDGSWLGYDARPSALKTALAYSLKRLRTDYVDIYRPARLDPAVPIEDTVGAIAELVKAGYVRHIGLSEVGADTIRRAHAVHPIADVQMEYSIVTRITERAILPALRELGIGMTAYGVLSRGLLTDRATAIAASRRHFPRFQGEHFAHNLSIVDALADIAREKGVTVAQLAIAWVLSRGADIVPLIGARRPERLAVAVAALGVVLTADDAARMESVVPDGAIRGQRYATHAMAALDSERVADVPA